MSIEVSWVPIGSIKPDPGNARTHSESQIAKIANSIEQFGFNNPILIDKRNVVIAGHGRLEAAKCLELQSVPVIRLEHLTPAQRKAYMLADNKLAELAGWDLPQLAVEFQALLDMDLQFEITDTGFEMAEIDQVLEESRLVEAGVEYEDEIPRLEDVEPVARPGDLWRLGNHLLFCGDALQAESYVALLGSERANVVFTDPPYNVPIDGHVSGLGKTRHREFVQGAGEMSDAEFSEFLATFCRHLAQFSTDGSIHFICMDWRHVDQLIAVGRKAYSELKNICVWAKPNAGMGSLYRSQHEFVVVFKSGTRPHQNNVKLGVHGRNRSNLWTYQGMSGFQKGRDEKLAMHPTVKPVAMIADATMDCSSRGDLVLDPFAGSGSTILAAERCGRRCRAIELDPRYVDVALARYEKATGKTPERIACGILSGDSNGQG
ncbi:site-specific DNA-methyltransferase [Aurantiacibacter sp. MUD11]|uniref:site-specific DNA-methyltransferase n=1 Tax=Aurantiacibacter sp. MUD11 TaxID=3003265 RepID=UPI0022AA16B5|nr:DNA methyltransferase [Aurantiacibacter sp. MUD11]WAT19278.1 site-specific DNA-methyltransferase [Aurantiacibacter sp. MUD11]